MGHDIRIQRSKLHPWLNYKLTLLLNQCEKKGIYLIITQGFRSKAEQDNLYAQGRTKPGNIVTNAKGSDYSSQHQWGIAFDIAINEKDIYNAAKIKEVAKIAKSKKVGLAWGGDWISPVDMPHFYLDKWGDTPRQLKTTYGNFETGSSSEVASGCRRWKRFPETDVQMVGGFSGRYELVDRYYRYSDDPAGFLGKCTYGHCSGGCLPDCP